MNRKLARRLRLATAIPTARPQVAPWMIPIPAPPTRIPMIRCSQPHTVMSNSYTYPCVVTNTLSFRIAEMPTMIPHNPAMIIKMAANMAKPVAHGLDCRPCAAAPDVACVAIGFLSSPCGCRQESPGANLGIPSAQGDRGAQTSPSRSRSATDVRGRSPGRTGLVEELDGTEQHRQRQGDGEYVAAARPVEEDDHEPSQQDQSRAQRG